MNNGFFCSAAGPFLFLHCGAPLTCQGLHLWCRCGAGWQWASWWVWCGPPGPPLVWATWPCPSPFPPVAMTVEAAAGCQRTSCGRYTALPPGCCLSSDMPPYCPEGTKRDTWQWRVNNSENTKAALNRLVNAAVEERRCSQIRRKKEPLLSRQQKIKPNIKALLSSLFQSHQEDILFGRTKCELKV